MKIHPVGAEMLRADRRTDITKLIVALRNFANAPKNCAFLLVSYYILVNFSFQWPKWLGSCLTSESHVRSLSRCVRFMARSVVEHRVFLSAMRVSPRRTIPPVRRGRMETESGGTRRRTGGEVKGKEVNGVGSQQSSA